MGEGEGTGFFPFNRVSADAVQGYVGRSGELLENVDRGRSNELNHFFGVHMTTQFLQSPNGKTDENQPVTYEFFGDDDVWIFLDGVLVGDVGGIHNKAGVHIDFSTGAISYEVTPSWGTADTPEGSTIFDQYKKAAAGDGSSGIVYRAAAEDGRPGTETSEMDASFAEVTLGNSIYTFKKTDAGGWIFVDDSYHTLDFFYLERGGYESNMTLKFNLEEIPPTYIKKVDQDGEPIENVEFQLYVMPRDKGEDLPAAQDAQDIPTGGLMVAEGKTDEDGILLLTYSGLMDARAGKLLSLADLYTSYWDELVESIVASDGNTYKNVLMLELREKTSQQGYRSTGTVSLRLENINGTYILRSNDRWNNGTYATPSVVVSSGKTVTLHENGSRLESADLSAVGTDQVGMFAVVLGWIGENPPDMDSIKVLSNWGLVQGNSESGWKIQRLEDAEADYSKALGAAIGAYAQANNGSVEGCAYRFEPTASGSYSATIDYLPGEIDDYYFMLADSDGNITGDAKIEDVKFSTAFYYSTAGSWETMDGSQTYRVNHRLSRFERKFAATISVPNTENRLIVQRLDAVGNTLVGAEFGLYKADAAEVIDGRLTIKPDAVPWQSRTTEDLEKDPENGIHVTAGGSAAFHGLEKGVYYVAEITPPPGYDKNPEVIKVIVDDNGVHAYAGDAKEGDDNIDQNKGIAYGDQDGISVLVGVGSLVNTMAQFGSIGEIDTTLTDIYVLRARARNADGSDVGRDVDELDSTWVEVASQNFTNLQRKWRVYDSDAALQYKYHTGLDILGKDNQMKEDENPNGYLSSSGWNWNLITQNYFGIYDQGKHYEDLYDGLTDREKAVIDEEISTKTRLPVEKGENHELSDGYTSYGNKILNHLFSGSTVIRMASGAHGSLSIAKKVEQGEDGASTDAADKSFSFAVRFAYTAPVLKEGRDPQAVGDIDYPTPQLAGTYGYTVADAGGATLEAGTLTIGEEGLITSVSPSDHFSGSNQVLLKDGETLTIEGLPAGISYTVQEGYERHYQASWVKTVSGTVAGEGASSTAEGKIEEANQAHMVTFTNTYTTTPVPPTETGSLTVSKTVSGDGADHDKDFQFTVALADSTIEDTYGDMTFTKGKAVFTLKGGESKTAAGLPAGIEYTVTESDNDGYTVTKTGDVGSIHADQTTEAHFNNHKDSGGPGGDTVDVTVKKVWKLDDGGRATELVRVALLQDGTLHDVVELTEGNGWQHTWNGLESRYSWTVEELNVPNGFTASTEKQGMTFTIINDDIPDIPQIDPIQPDVPDNPEPPRTGEFSYPVWLPILAAGALLAMLGLAGRNRRSGKHKA